jgi:hypothetical protein
MERVARVMLIARAVSPRRLARRLPLISPLGPFQFPIPIPIPLLSPERRPPRRLRPNRKSTWRPPSAPR